VALKHQVWIKTYEIPMEASLERLNLIVREAVCKPLEKESLNTTTVKRGSLKKLLQI
jgi:hypothetical protein